MSLKHAILFVASLSLAAPAIAQEPGVVEEAEVTQARAMDIFSLFSLALDDENPEGVPDDDRNQLRWCIYQYSMKDISLFTGSLLLKNEIPEPTDLRTLYQAAATVCGVTTWTADPDGSVQEEAG